MKNLSLNNIKTNGYVKHAQAKIYGTYRNILKNTLQERNVDSYLI